MGDWTRYYDASGDEPRETLLDALERFEAEAARARPRLAVDLGCGTGRDTAELLRRGWRVLAVDAEPEAIERLRARPGLDDDRLETLVAHFEDVALPRADLVNSSFALPFCPPERFREVWTRIGASLVRGGRFAGQLFGDRDAWAGDPELTFLTREEVDELLASYEVERLEEQEHDGRTALGEPKHWHVFQLVARKPPRP